MVDVNKIVREILETLDGIKVTFFHPKAFNSFPTISYYELTTTTGLCYDNAEQAQSSNMQIDIWSKSGGECSRIAVKVDEAMQSNGWCRELSRDMPPENGICQKTMRFKKELYFEEE